MVAAGCTMQAYWEDLDINPFCGVPFCLNFPMSQSRFDAITNALTYTDSKPPTYCDRFHEVQQMIDAWNKRMKEVFLPGWVSG